MKEQQLNDLSIFALRELARRTGVSSPTSKRKNELINEIIEIQEGKKQPIISSKQGRPPKGYIFSIDNVVEDREKLLSFQQNEEKENLDACMLSGYVEKLNNNVGFLWVKDNEKYKNYFIPSNAFKDNILSGNYVTAQLIKNEDALVVKNILTVEGYAVDNVIHTLRYEELDHVNSSVKIAQNNQKFNNLNIYFGENVYIYGNNNLENAKGLVELLNSCDADVKMYVNFALVEKQKNILKDIKNAEVFISNMLDEQDYVERIINIATERAKRYIEQGKNVVLAIDDVLTISSINHNLLKAMMCLTKNAVNGSITILAIMSNNQSVSVFEKLADKKLNVINNNLVEI